MPLISVFLLSLMVIVRAQESTPECEAWSKFFNTDTPDDGEDVEKLAEVITRLPLAVCSNPVAIDVRVVDLHDDYRSTGQVVIADPKNGFICRDNDQEEWEKCLDYEVRYCCPAVIGTCQGESSWSEWFGVGDVTEDGDNATIARFNSEFNANICSHPVGLEARLVNENKPYLFGENLLVIGLDYGLSCVRKVGELPELLPGESLQICKDYKVRFCCEKIVVEESLECEAWTSYINNDTPCDGQDAEKLEELLWRLPMAVCASPTAIEARTVEGGTDYRLTGQVVTVDPKIGLLCQDESQQEGEKCLDYEVRYCCPAVIGTCPDEMYWSRWFGSGDVQDAGDDATIFKFNSELEANICQRPDAIEARLVLESKPYLFGHNMLDIRLDHGLSCVKDLNFPKGNPLEDRPIQQICQDYKIRFCCTSNIGARDPEEFFQLVEERYGLTDSDDDHDACLP